MSLKLLKYEIKDLFHSIWVLLLAFVIDSGLVLLADHLVQSNPASRLYIIFFGICMIAIIFLLIAITLICFLNAWKKIISCFFNKQAHLIRTLPLSRSQIFWTQMVFQLLFTIFITLLLCCLGWLLMKSYQAKLILEINGDDIEQQFVRYFIPLFLIQIFLYFINGTTGILLGFKRPNSKISWSILFGVVIYYALQLIDVGAFFLYFFAQGYNLETLDNASGDVVKQILLVISILMLVSSLILVFIDYRMVKKGIDVDA